MFFRTRSEFRLSCGAIEPRQAWIALTNAWPQVPVLLRPKTTAVLNRTILSGRRLFLASLYQLWTGRKPTDGQTFDPVCEGYVNAPTIADIIVACCCDVPAAGPTMQEMIRILKGERWADIQTEKKKRQDQVGTLCFLGALAVLGFLVAKSGKASA
jgi:hypothetical protein